ncbi:hypothetical protein GCM10007161_03870 [Ignatzschineria indica]|nr:hypothetical protein GCM10007161_03870 [Ignatzschineria indica]
MTVQPNHIPADAIGKLNIPAPIMVPAAIIAPPTTEGDLSTFIFFLIGLQHKFDLLVDIAHYYMITYIDHVSRSASISQSANMN